MMSLMIWDIYYHINNYKYRVCQELNEEQLQIKEGRIYLNTQRVLCGAEAPSTVRLKKPYFMLGVSNLMTAERRRVISAGFGKYKSAPLHDSMAYPIINSLPVLR